MRLQTLILALLISAYLWIGAFDATRFVYRMAEQNALIPNLHIGQTLSRLI